MSSKLETDIHYNDSSHGFPQEVASLIDNIFNIQTLNDNVNLKCKCYIWFKSRETRQDYSKVWVVHIYKEIKKKKSSNAILWPVPIW